MKVEGRPRTKAVVDLRTNDPPSSKHIGAALASLAIPKALIKKDTSLSRQVDGFSKIPRLSDKEQWDKNMKVIDEVYTSTHARGPRQRFTNGDAARRNDSTRNAVGGQWIKQTRGPRK